MQKTKFALSIVSAAALLTLAACGGGGGDSNAPTQQPSNPAPPAPTITVQGSAPAITADPVALIFVPQDAVSAGASSHAYLTAAAAASAQKVSAEGAYTTVGANSSIFTSLTAGTVADVAGTADYSIGRWTNGTTSQGNLSVNQGAHYAVGRPLTLVKDTTVQPDLSVGAKLNCSAVAATKPTAVSGNFPVGVLNTATAVVDMGGPFVQTLTIDAGIGSDAHVSKTVTAVPVAGVGMSASGTFQLESLGTSQSAPYLAVGYTIPSPSSGDVSGVVVLSCK